MKTRLFYNGENKYTVSFPLEMLGKYTPGMFADEIDNIKGVEFVLYKTESCFIYQDKDIIKERVIHFYIKVHEIEIQGSIERYILQEIRLLLLKAIKI